MWLEFWKLLSPAGSVSFLLSMTGGLRRLQVRWVPRVMWKRGSQSRLWSGEGYRSFFSQYEDLEQRPENLRSLMSKLVHLCLFWWAFQWFLYGSWLQCKRSSFQVANCDSATWLILGFQHLLGSQLHKSLATFCKFWSQFGSWWSIICELQHSHRFCPRFSQDHSDDWVKAGIV